MLYDPEYVRNVLWNAFTFYADEIKFLEQIGTQYWYSIIFNKEITLDRMNDILEELHDTGIFDVINEGPTTLIKYTGEDDIMDVQEMRTLMEKMAVEYVDFPDEQIKRNMKLYSFLPNNVANSPFVQSVYNRMLSKKRLTKRQWEELKYILDNGKTKYNNNQLTTKN